MELVAIVILLALIQYNVFGILVGRARATYNVPAPATSGDPTFERYWRVHQNTLEQLLVFIPAILVFGYYVNYMIAALAGVVFIIGRFIYLQGYVKDPAKRAPGFIIGFLATAVLVIGGIIGAVRNLL